MSVIKANTDITDIKVNKATIDISDYGHSGHHDQGAYLGFCRGGCTFLADLPPPVIFLKKI